MLTKNKVFTDLSFVGEDSSGEFTKVLPWSPKRSGNYEQDCATGRACFAELLDFMTQQDNPLFLSRVLHAQVEGGKWEAVEIGFAHAMSERLV